MTTKKFLLQLTYLYGSYTHLTKLDYLKFK